MCIFALSPIFFRRNISKKKKKKKKTLLAHLSNFWGPELSIEYITFKLCILGFFLLVPRQQVTVFSAELTGKG